jgi:LytR cell envelope-related transcriptional attenuator
MNERVPDSTGLPLRAMVMVLLFLGVIFLLVGFQAMGSGGSSDDDSSVSSVTTRATTTKTSAKVAAKSDIRVYNISSSTGVAGRTADQLKQGGYNVTEVSNLSLPDVSATTVYFGSAAGERETADAVGQLLKAPVAPRTPAVADQPPGVIVVVTG